MSFTKKDLIKEWHNNDLLRINYTDCYEYLKNYTACINGGRSKYFDYLKKLYFQEYINTTLHKVEQALYLYFEKFFSLTQRYNDLNEFTDIAIAYFIKNFEKTWPHNTLQYVFDTPFNILPSVLLKIMINFSKKQGIYNFKCKNRIKNIPYEIFMNDKLYLFRK